MVAPEAFDGRGLSELPALSKALDRAARHCELRTGLRPTPMDETDFAGVVLVWW
jgi:hypothetical protein